ncbi:MAG TPA: pyridoxamine 5'-phosphate oxidase family protein [Puia sp.]|nr:pyridoxamine 5'-phosphate oxidase family protein [Puia sp.]
MNTITNEIKEFVNRTKLGFVATVCPDGSPNLSPKGTVLAWDKDHLVFADIHSPGSVANLKLNPAIEINVVDIFTRRGYRFKGQAEIFTEGSVFEEVVAFLRAAGSTHVIRHIVRVNVDRLQPVWSPAYDAGQTEEEIRRRWIDYWDEKR